jgi:hypothetical protein
MNAFLTGFPIQRLCLIIVSFGDKIHEYDDRVVIENITFSNKISQTDIFSKKKSFLPSTTANLIT